MFCGASSSGTQGERLMNGGMQYLGGAWKKVGPPVLMDDWGEAG